MFNKTFIKAHLDGNCTLKDIDNYISYWFEESMSLELYRFLGLTEEEYARWLTNPESLKETVAKYRKAREIKIQTLLSNKEE